MQDMKALRGRYKFPDNYIINMDETLIFFNMTRTCSIAKTGAQEVQVTRTNGGEKRVRFLVACCIPGQMLKPVVVFKGRTAFRSNCLIRSTYS